MIFAHRAVFVLVVMCFTATTSLAQQASYAQVRVSAGPVIEYPAHWTIANDAIVKNLVHAAQATADVASVDMSGFQKQGRVIIESQPIPSSAQIRASIVTPQEYTQEDLRIASASDLRALRTEFEDTLRKMSRSGSVKLHKMGYPRVEEIAGKLALVFPYTRYTETDPVLWHVEQIKIPFEDKLLSLTISYRSSHVSTMKPILERVKRTLKF